MATLAQIEAALRNADAAGDTAAARALAGEYQRLLSAPAAPMSRETLGAPPTAIPPTGLAPDVPLATDEPQLPEVPPAVRAMVGMTTRPEHRMTILRQFFPQAIITPSDEEGSNYTIDDPTMGKLQYNTPGLLSETAPAGGGLAGAVAGSPSMVGDLASIGSEAGEMLGGTVGAVAGAPGGPMGSAAGAGLGAAAGQEAYRQVAAPLLEGATGVTMPSRTLSEMGADAGTTALLNAGGQVGGELLGYASKWAAKAIFRGGKEGGRQFAQAVTDANRWGVPISVGQAADNAWGVFDTMAGTQARHFRQETEKAVGEQVRRMSQTIGKGRGLTYQSVGRAVQRGVEDYNVAFRARGHALDQEFYNLVPPTSSVPTPNTIAAIQRIMPDLPSMPATEAAAQAAPLGQRMTRLLQDIQDGGGALNFNDMRTYRRQIGEMMDAGGLGQVPDIPFIQLSDLHGALTADMEGLARANGPAAAMAFKRSQEYWKKELTTMQDVIRPIVAKNVPSDIARALEGKMKNAPEYVREILDTLSKEQRDVVRAATIRKLGQVPKAGKAVGETWSFDKFLADWGGLDRTVRNTLFKDTGYLSDLDALVRTAERLGQAKTVGGEPPIPKYMVAGGVGAAVMTGAGLTGGVAPWLMLPIGFALTSMGAAGGQHLMRNRVFVNWLAKAVTTSPNGIGAHMGRLAAIAENSDPQTRDDIKTFMENLGPSAEAQREAPTTQLQGTEGAMPEAFYDRYNTPLSPDEEKRFQQFVQQESARRKKDMSQELNDYDLRGWWAQGRKGDNMAPMKPGEHLVDNWKKPNHPTFSNESIYHGQGGLEGGQWAPLPGGKWAFTPGHTNLELHSPAELQDYWRRVEPNNALILPR